VSEKMFSREQYEQWRSFPEISRDELFRYFTLTSGDVAFVDPGAGRGPEDRLGLSVQLSSLPWLGFVPDDVASAPPVAVARLAEQLGLDPGALRGYGKRAHTRSDHLNKVARYLGWKTAAAGSREMTELEQFLLDRAIEHDSGRKENRTGIRRQHAFAQFTSMLSYACGRAARHTSSRTTRH
jgi:hypothetical protein